MSRLPRDLRVVGAALATVVVAFSASQVKGGENRESSDNSGSAIARLAEELESSELLVGFQIAVSGNGRWVYSGAHGYADLEHRVAMQPGSRVAVASVTKAVTALSALALAEEGKLDLDAPVQHYLPDFPRKEREITARLLAECRSGLPHYPGDRGPDWYATHYYTHYEDITDALALFSQKPLVGEPGGFQYSSYGFNLLAAIIQTASGERFQSFVEQRILSPMGLEETSFADVYDVVPDRARLYSHFEVAHGARKPASTLRRVPDAWDYSYNAGGGGLWSSARDLVRFGEHSIGASEASRVRDYYRTTDGGFFFGWWGGLTGSHVSYRAQGGVFGSYADLRVFPDAGLVVAFVTNTESPLRLGEITEAIGRAHLENVDPVLLWQAERAYSAARWAEAAASFQALTSAGHGDSSVSWYKLGRSYHQLKDYDQAAAAYRQAIRLAGHPEWHDTALLRLAQVHAMQGAIEEAVAMLDELRRGGRMTDQDWLYVNSESDFDPIRSKPGFLTFLRRIGVVTEP